jgi:hypothetical protein
VVPSGSKVRPFTLGNSLALSVRTNSSCVNAVAIRSYKLTKNIFTSSNCVMLKLI